VNNFFLESVTERDIDLLVLEEFYSSIEFRTWFLNKLDCDLSAKCFSGAWHSVIHPSLGESDIEVEFITGKTIFRIFIENKIDAELQPEQAERYVKRAKEKIQSGECTKYTVVLLAPEKYVNKKVKEQFEKIITYEELQKYFLKEKGERNNYKSKILDLAIEQARRGYQPITDEKVTNFWQQYWHLTMAIAPELEMKEPIEKPARAGFVEFKPAILPKGYRLVHKLPHGNVDLEISGQANKLLEIKNKINLKNAIVTKAGKSAAIRIKTPKIDTKIDFLKQKEKIIDAILKAKKLLQTQEQLT